ncbi:MAG: GyrI-like domain-containing protein [Candidatus Ornithospirochaeta sp.]
MVPEGFSLYTFPESEWALFSTKGPIPSSIQELNTYIWKDWMETEGKEKGAKVKATIEVYSVGNPRSPEYESGIWIPISRN